MAAVINTNLASINAQRNLGASQANLNKSIERLSSGLRINSAKDDAAGLSISTRMDSQIRGSNVAIRNANDAISFAQTADGALGNVADALQRMRELAVQSANATNNSGDRTNLNTEFSQLQAEITRITGGTKFNGNDVLKGGATNTFQVGADASETIDVTGTDLTAAAAETAIAAGGTIKVDGADATNATAAITQIDKALDEINTERSTYGAVQNRFQSVISNLQNKVEATSAAKSRIMDADFAQETANLTRGQILQQAGTAMLAQANSLPNGVLALLRG